VTPAPRSRTLGLTPRHVRRVTPEHVGQRVSIRRWVADPDRGPVQSDTVGRLVAWEDDDTLVVVDRAGNGTRLAAADVVSSRVVPEHPRLEPEPADAGTRERPLTEHVVRVLVLDADDRVLLQAREGETTWRAPGARVAPRTEPADAATALLREVFDEPAAVAPPVGPVVLTRTRRQRIASTWWDVREEWHWCPGASGPAAAPLTWWRLDDLDGVTLDPDDLDARLPGWVRHGPPGTPDRVS
jgi:hypothetical protein